MLLQVLLQIAVCLLSPKAQESTITLFTCHNDTYKPPQSTQTQNPYCRQLYKNVYIVQFIYNINPILNFRYDFSTKRKFSLGELRARNDRSEGTNNFLNNL